MQPVPVRNMGNLHQYKSVLLAACTNAEVAKILESKHGLEADDRSGIQALWVPSPALFLPCWVILYKSPHFLASQSPNPWDGENGTGLLSNTVRTTGDVISTMKIDTAVIAFPITFLLHLLPSFNPPDSSIHLKLNTKGLIWS